jgi:predicted ester cyclase
VAIATPEQNLATSRRWLLEVFNERQLDAVPEIIADDYRNFGTTGATGVEGGRQVITQADGWAPDRRISIKYQAAQDDVVLLLFSVEGTHTGEFMGVPPSGKRFQVWFADAFRFNEDGKMVEGWVIGKGDAMLAMKALHDE